LTHHANGRSNEIEGARVINDKDFMQFDNPYEDEKYVPHNSNDVELGD